MATQCLNNGRIRFHKDNDFQTSELVIVTKHMRFLLGPNRIIVKGGIARAYECAKQLEELTAKFALPTSAVVSTVASAEMS